MRLLVLEPDPSFGGGSEAVVLSLARELAGRGHGIVLLHERDGSMLDDYRAFAADTVQAALPGFALRAPLRTLGCVLRIGRIARATGADAILSSHLGFLQHAALLRRLAGVRACFHLGLSLEHPPRTLRLALGSAGAGVAPSVHSLASWQAGGWDPRALHLVRNWVDARRFTPVADLARLRRDAGMAPDARHIVFVGRLCRQKGVDTLVEAFRQVAATRSDLHLHLVGPVAPEFREALEAALARAGNATRARIRLLPATAHPERFYAAADLACAPSIGDEAFGLTVLEAMACAVPVVATTIGIVPQLLGEDDAGLLAAPGDADSLAGRLAWWIDRPAERAAAGARLRRRALDAYGPDESVDRYEAILSDLVGVDRTPRAATTGAAARAGA
jgi:glycosyltransferase involved in cell wall biosynthesis